MMEEKYQKGLAALRGCGDWKAEAVGLRRALHATTVAPADNLTDSSRTSLKLEGAAPEAGKSSEVKLRRQREEQERVLNQLRAQIELEKQSPLPLTSDILERAHGLPNESTSNCRGPSPLRSTRSPSPSDQPPSTDRSWASASANDTRGEEAQPAQSTPLPPAGPKGGKGIPPPCPPQSGKGGNSGTASGRGSWPKGKGKGVCPGPPPPCLKKRCSEGDNGSRLVNLHWRPSAEPREEDVSAAGDPFLNGMVDMLPAQRRASLQYLENQSAYERAVGICDDAGLGMDSAAILGRASTCSMEEWTTIQYSDRYGEEIRTHLGRDVQDDDVIKIAVDGEKMMTFGQFATFSGEELRRQFPIKIKRCPAQAQRLSVVSSSSDSSRRRRSTIFNEECPVVEMSQYRLEEFFQIRRAAVEINPRPSLSSVRSLITDSAHLQIIGILIKTEAILRHAHLKGQKSEDAAVDALVLAIRTCDYDRVSTQALEDIRKVTTAHLKDESRQNVLQFVETRGEESLQRLDNPHVHRLIYEALRIPAVSLRFECMILDANAEDSLRHCQLNLKLLGNGLEALSKILGSLGRFFAAAKMLGNALNRGANGSAPVSKYGFKISSISRMLELKSQTHKEVSLFHFVLLITPAADLAQLCDQSIIDCLTRAKSARSNTVYQDCVQFLDGFRNIQQLLRTGKFKDQDGKLVEIPRDGNNIPQLLRAGKYKDRDGKNIGIYGDALKGGDAFFEKMNKCVAKHERGANGLQQQCAEIFETYKRFAIYFDDSKYFYPPPTDEQTGEEKKDLFEYFQWLLSQVKQANAEIIQLGLPSEFGKLPIPSAPEADISHAASAISSVAESAVSQAPSAISSAPEPAISQASSAQPISDSSEPPAHSPLLKIPGLASFLGSPTPRSENSFSGNCPTEADHFALTVDVAAPSQGAPPSRPVNKNLFLDLPTLRAIPGVPLHDSKKSLSSPCESESSPSRTNRKCRKSVTTLANKAERQGISRVLGENAALASYSRASSCSSTDRSLSPGENASEHTSLSLGLTAEIREEARIRSARYRGPESPGASNSSGEESPPRRQRRASPDYFSNRYCLSPVWEQRSDASDSVTPARRQRRDLASPVSQLTTIA